MVKLKKFALFIPSSIIEDCQDDLSRTIKVGLVARAAAIFNVNNIIIYKGGEKKPGRNTVFLKTLLDYIDCPQYLRKRLFPIKKELRSVGVLPPLEAPHHRRLGDLKKLKKGEVRQGVVVHKDREYSYVD
ncbi:MAG: putative RNA uridine N3 methyltransferase, partial [Candidatus Odinarchaeia archaeon]